MADQWFEIFVVVLLALILIYIWRIAERLQALVAATISINTWLRYKE
jgi:hypothetical protein